MDKPKKPTEPQLWMLRSLARYGYSIHHVYQGANIRIIRSLKEKGLIEDGTSRDFGRYVLTGAGRAVLSSYPETK